MPEQVPPSSTFSSVKVAIVHYWLYHMRGGERVVDALCQLFPDADIYTHVYDAQGVSPTIRRHRVRTTFVGKLPFAQRLYKVYLPLMPLALKLLDLKDYDLVISSESGPAKGISVGPGALHVCYCHSPMRYAWEMEEAYLAPLAMPARVAARFLLKGMRAWDRASAKTVDYFVANSREVAGRIRRYYGRDAEVVHPPVDVERFAASESPASADTPYLVVSHLAGYKRVDIAVDACTRTARPLVVVGTGPELERLRSRAGPTVNFLGYQSDAEIARHYAASRALLFPGLEDFGITPVEAMASGRPVIAYAQGGALETVQHGVTGIHFRDQTVESLVAAMEELERGTHRFDPIQLRAYAMGFSRERFVSQMREALARARQQHAPK
jgi:glycosyltransferase involved in cell wall biosynthesis